MYRAYRPALIAFATPILGSREAAEDVVQEAFLRFSPTLSRTGYPAQPLGYLYRIVRNLALDVLKRRKIEAREAEHEMPFWTRPRSEATPEQSALFCAQVKIVSRVMEQLPEKARQAVELHRFGGHTLEEVADELGISVATAHRYVRSALIEIAEALAAERN
ncbi:RNA polymerase sigma factor [Rhodoligotrophos defluvii]|uniref:RNA polymerase sigma factor n=1 Tax=Rhodoligotrophos defluvii TaxID=2561934 RepID=UPI0010C9898D|nr:sigma-70 family RNA polymerase sigma factor [Rhodoligotrophos defluvii]